METTPDTSDPRLDEGFFDEFDAALCHDGRGGGCGRPWRECVCGDVSPDALDVEAAADDARWAARG